MFSLSQLFKTKNTYVFCHSQTATWPMALGGKQKVPSSVSIHSTPGNSAKTTPFNSSGKPRCAEYMEKFTQRKGKTWPHEQGKIGWVNIPCLDGSDPHKIRWNEQIWLFREHRPRRVSRKSRISIGGNVHPPGGVSGCWLLPSYHQPPTNPPKTADSMGLVGEKSHEHK